MKVCCLLGYVVVPVEISRTTRIEVHGDSFEQSMPQDRSLDHYIGNCPIPSSPVQGPFSRTLFFVNSGTRRAKAISLFREDPSGRGQRVIQFGLSRQLDAAGGPIARL